MWCCLITRGRMCWRTRRRGRRCTAYGAGACQNVCPVYRQTGGHAYGSVYAGPIGAILTPQLQKMEHARSLPYASSLCGACYEVCPVKINIPEVLIHLRGLVVEQETAGFKVLGNAEAIAMKAMAVVFGSEERLRLAQKLGRLAEGPLVRRGMGRASGGLGGCRGCWGDGRRCGTCGRCRRRVFGSGGMRAVRLPGGRKRDE